MIKKKRETAKKEREMSITSRQEQILALLNANRFLTVERLAKLTYASPSSIRRDLAKLQSMCFLKRTHGGASILDESNQAAPFNNRMLQNAVAKKKIAKKAEGLLCDGQTVMLDGSSTAAFLVPHIAKHKDIKLFTNNMITAINAINYGIETHCIGGNSVNHSAVLSGTQSYRAVLEIFPDILFFSSHSLDAGGVISDPTEEENYLRKLMLQNARQKVFLCDSEKFNRRALYTLASLDEVDMAIFDAPFQGLKTKCKLL
ncbi:MAG: DeoR/GlpR transcriptional regulator [Ruminococcaceae bacterium]|nr:DeoR/GlpR transcriptional regulator [Oscillospiraceae bacterium]